MRGKKEMETDEHTNCACTHTDVYDHTGTHTNTHIDTHDHTHTDTHDHTDIQTHTDMHYLKYTNVCMRACAHVCAHTHTHTRKLTLVGRKAENNRANKFAFR